jgi:hypothetical protein
MEEPNVKSNSTIGSTYNLTEDSVGKRDKSYSFPKGPQGVPHPATKFEGNVNVL